MIVNPAYLHSDTTGEVLSVAFEVHKYIGCGFIERVYHNSMMVECKLRNITYESEKELPIYYKNKKVGSRRADLLFNEKVIVEIKALSKLEDVHLAQAINYLEAFNLEVGLLINFGAKSLEYKRLIHPRLLKIKPT